MEGMTVNNPAQEQMPVSTSTPGVTKHEKIRTPLAKIIVGESFGKPYYEIMWFSMDYEKCDIGYGSFSLDIVRDYLKDEFEIIEQDSAHDVAPVVRCKGCQNWKRNVGFTDSPNGHCFEHDIDTNGKDFCSYGERMRQAKREKADDAEL